MPYKSRYGYEFFVKERIEERRKEALDRNTKWQSLSLVQQIAELDKRFGKDLGAKEQRVRINQMITAGLTHNPKKEKVNGKHDSKPTPRDAKGAQRAQSTTREAIS